MKTEKQKVKDAIEILKSGVTQYSCHALDDANITYETRQLYKKFLTSHYPMFFKFRNNNVRYSQALNGNKKKSIELEIFDPNKRSLDIRLKFLRQFSKYL